MRIRTRPASRRRRRSRRSSTPIPRRSFRYTKVPNLNSKAEGDTVAVYVQDQLEFTPQWKALLGVRYEHFDSEAQTLSRLAGVNGAGPFSRKDDMVSGRAGFIWQPTH